VCYGNGSFVGVAYENNALAATNAAAICF
jgi:hypothetical protein